MIGNIFVPVLRLGTHACTLGLSSSSFFCFWYLPVRPCPFSPAPLKHHIHQQVSVPRFPSPQQLFCLPHAPQSLLFAAVLLHFYSLSICEVIDLCACLFRTSKGLKEVKATASHSVLTSPMMSLYNPGHFM